MSDITRCPSCGAPEPRLHPSLSGGGEVPVLCSDPFHLTHEWPRPVSASYNIGSRVPGDTTIPVRIVAQDGSDGLLMRCVALRSGGRPCHGEWRLTADRHFDPDLCDAVAVQDMYRHMQLEHPRRD